MPDHTSKLLVYHLGTGYGTTREGKPLYSWPYSVDYTPGCPQGEFFLSEGDARNGNGAFFPAASVLGPEWRGHLETAGALWLVPLLERMARGEDVSRSEVLDAYRHVHGKPPPEEEWHLP
jgi:hypothetical protein